MQIINYIYTIFIDNINLIKDIIAIMVSVIMTVIAILTYRKAKYTLLQPLRTEVVKKQTDILLDVSLYLKGYSKDSYDYYHEVILINIPSILKEYGFMLNQNQEEQNQKYKRIICSRSKNLESVEVISTFCGSRNNHIDSNEKSSIQISKEKFERLAKNDVDLETIAISEKFDLLLNHFNELSDNIFLPTSIKNSLDELITEINQNISIIKIVLENFLLEIYKQYKNNEQNHLAFNPVGVCNEFNRVCVNHRTSIRKILTEARLFLRIENKW
jgi:hypothetical protein